MKKLCIVMMVLFVFLLAMSALLALIGKNGLPIGEKIALVRISGPILESTDTVEEIKKHAEDSSIKAILLRVDSPGGAVAPSQEIYEEVKRAALKKKVVVSMGSIAASGGYYISSPASKIIANPGTMTGSIGVIMEIPNIEGLMDKIGIRTEVIKSGRHKDIASVFRKMQDEDRMILQDVLTDVHEQFIKAVSEGRKMPVEEVRKIADGRIFTGKQALSAGLVDGLGNIQDATDEAAKLAGIKGKPHIVKKKETLSFLEMLMGQFPKEFADLTPSIKIKYLYIP